MKGDIRVKLITILGSLTVIRQLLDRLHSLFLASRLTASDTWSAVTSAQDWRRLRNSHTTCWRRKVGSQTRAWPLYPQRRSTMRRSKFFFYHSHFMVFATHLQSWLSMYIMIFYLALLYIPLIYFVSPHLFSVSSSSSICLSLFSFIFSFFFNEYAFWRASKPSQFYETNH